MDWPRPHFEPNGGDASLFYAVYGPPPPNYDISRETYRCTGLPDGLDMLAYGPESHPEVVDSFRQGFLWESLKQDDPKLAIDVSMQRECFVLHGDVVDPIDLNYFRNVIGLITFLLDAGAVAVYDPYMLKWWSAAAWRAEVFAPEQRSPLTHVVILVSQEENGTAWFHTRGMRKFGRPDISVHGVTRAHRNAVTELCNHFIEFQAQGGIIGEGEEIKMSSLPAGMLCSHRGDLDDPDFNNVHVEVTWPAGKSA